MSQREDLVQRIDGTTIWLTGLPCAGKSTLANRIAFELGKRSHQVEVLDADVVRATLCRGLGFTKQDRDENVTRIGWVCRVLNRHGVTALVAAVSPYRETRQNLRNTIPRFVEVYVKAPLDVCIERDVKGMYRKAIAGEIAQFTGIDDPYEEPKSPDVVVDTSTHRVEECVDLVMTSLAQAGLVGPSVVPFRGPFAIG